MISDPLTNTVYFADTLQKDRSADCKEFTETLESYGINVKILKATKDWYCRDFMPVQTDKDRYVQFVFQPSYFRKQDLRYLTNPVLTSLANDIPKPVYSRIILDGGNVVKWKDKVIITDQVYENNRHQFKSRNAIRKELENDLQCNVIIIPRYPEEKTGHADGLIRFADDKRVFVNQENGDNPEWEKKFLAVLKANHLEPIEIPCMAETLQTSGKGLYINYLHVGSLVVVPQFNLKQDDDAVSILKNTLAPACHVIPYKADWIAVLGGVFNCGTWTICQ